jgi:Abortive infection alpha
MHYCHDTVSTEIKTPRHLVSYESPYKPDPRSTMHGSRAMIETSHSASNNLSNAADVGKQALDVVKAADASLDAVKKAATFMDGLFGNAVSNSIGLVSDKLAYYRLERAILLAERVDDNLRKKGVKRRYVPVNFGLPIIEKASVESDPNLSEKWANLLTNAADSTYRGSLRRNFTSILADMEPIDATILDLVVKLYIGQTDKSALYDRTKLAGAIKISVADCENAIRNLIRLGLFKPGVVPGGLQFGEHVVSAYKDTELFGVTQLGVDFFKAVNLEALKN